MSTPFKKFFNQNESYCPVDTEAKFNKICHNFELREKADGTCIQIWKNPYTERWVLSTLGRISNPEFRELFLSMVPLSRLNEFLVPQYTYLFELCCQSNRVVTQYQTDRVYIIGALDIKSGCCLPQSDIDIVATNLPVFQLKRFSFQELGLKTLKQVQKFVETESKNTHIYGNSPEGFVVYHEGLPLCKMKNKEYHQKHGICTGQLGYVRNIIIDRFFEGTVDDVYGLCSRPMKDFIGELSEKTKAMLEEVREISRNVANVSPNPEQKEYVETVTRIVPQNYRAFFLRNRDPVLESSSRDIGPIFLENLKKMYYTFNPLWKDSKIPELMGLKS